MTFQFKIQIKGITKPPVWRKVAVPADFTFLRFHHVIQTAFGWENEHLFGFQDKEWGSDLNIALPVDDPFFGPDLNDGAKDANTTRLSDVFNDGFRKLLYIYDYGDNWMHDITLEAIGDDKQKKAVCLAGKGACPPEDCGGPYGYEGIKEVLAKEPQSEQAEEIREWLGLDDGEVWDATLFDLEEVNVSLLLT
jgi:hypothetical protein